MYEFKHARRPDESGVARGIQLRGVTVRRSGREILHRVDFDAKSGEVIGLMGPNGTGKSSFLLVLAGLLIPSGGEGSICGVDLMSGAPRRCGMMFEYPPFIENRSGRDNLLLLDRYDGTSAMSRDSIDALLRTVGLAEAASKEPVRRYSQGMRKRLGLAQAIMGDPPLLLLDEPMNGLDPEGIVMMRDVVRSCAERGAIVVISSHLLDELAKTCTAVYMVQRRTFERVSGQTGEPGALEREYLRLIG